MSTPNASPSTDSGQLFEIVEEEVEGHPLRVFKNAPPTVRGLWDLSAAHGDATYLVYEDERISYTDAHLAVSSLADWLVEECGVVKGDRVAIGMRNYPEWALSFWAAAAIGAVAVPLNAWWTGPELDYAVRDSGCRVLITDGERLERLDPYLEKSGLEAVAVARCGSPAAGVLPVAELTARRGLELPVVDLDPDDDVLIMYTSGTTGKPKGAVVTHRNIGAQVMNLMWVAARTAGAGTTAIPSPPATLLTFPLFHVGGLHSFLIPYTVTGGKIVLLFKWDASKALRLIEEEGVNALAGVPTTMFQLLDEADRRGRSLESLEGIASGATLVPPELVRRIDSQLHSRAAPSNAYGLTETAGAAVVNLGGDYLERAESVGKPISPVIDVLIADDDGTPRPVGEVGEIWLRGPTVFRGYWADPDATAVAIADGWFRTGDAGRLDDEGYLYVVDRLKDVIIRGGENIYAAEVEAVLYEHPDVLEAAIIGVPDTEFGEAVAAVVRLRADSQAGESALRRLVGRRLAAFKVPAIVQLTTQELPRNAAGKVLKNQLRDALTSTPGD
jgi:long-chain acyl-CoA synthetase